MILPNFLPVSQLWQIMGGDNREEAPYRGTYAAIVTAPHRSRVKLCRA